ncbi:MAG TPA: hypothetical protein VGD80_31640, partial [Kofleriaceae bacterium]
SGHGRLTREGKLFLCVADTATSRIPVSGVAASTLRDCMDASDAQTLVVILDCCHSGAFKGGLLSDELVAGRGTFVLASSRARQLADDGDGRGPSPFTAAVVAALTDPDSDIDGDGYITFDDLYRVAYSRLAQRKQFPQRSTGEGTVALARSSAQRVEPFGRAARDSQIRLPAVEPVRSRPVERLPELPAASDGSRSVAELFRELHVRLLAGFAADAVVRAAAIAERALGAIAGKPPDARVPLAGLIDELRRAGAHTLLSDAAWLAQALRAALPLRGQVCEALDDDGRRAGEIALRLVIAAGLMSPSEAVACQRGAEWDASRAAPSALLRLDRVTHRKAFDDLLELPGRVLVVLVHGEADQGHDHFDKIMTWRVRSVQEGRWRDLPVAWPEPSGSLGARLSLLYEELANAVGVAGPIPAENPATPDGQAAWEPTVAAIVDAIDACPERLLVRHSLRWLKNGAGGDDALVGAYLRTIWSAVARRTGERAVVGLDLRRSERAGMPMTRSWRVSRAELRVARAIANVVDRLEMHGGRCIALPELMSVDNVDLIAWLRGAGGRKHEVAVAEADQVLSSTRGGRFDRVVERLTALNLDRHERIP